MYELVNQGVQSFITRKFGKAGWKDICQCAGLPDQEFDSLVTPPGGVACGLVGAICEKHAMTAPDILDASINMSMPFLNRPVFAYEVGGNGAQKLHCANDREGVNPNLVGHVHGPERDTGQDVITTQKPHLAYDGLPPAFTLQFAHR